MGFMAIKIDFEKAYDRLRCTFIRDSLLELCLPQNMVDLVMNCVTSAKLQILRNGEPTTQFLRVEVLDKETPCHLTYMLYVWKD